MLRVKRLRKNEIADNRDHRSENVRLSTLWRFLIPRVYSGNGYPKKVFERIFDIYSVRKRRGEKKIRQYRRYSCSRISFDVI